MHGSGRFGNKGVKSPNSNDRDGKSDGLVWISDRLAPTRVGFVPQAVGPLEIPLSNLFPHV